MLDERYNMIACKDAVRMHIETLKEDPIRLLGKFTLRAIQDPLFNTTMLEALKEYIEVHNIQWNN